MEKLFILWHSVKSLLRPGKSPSFIFNPISTSASASLGVVVVHEPYLLRKYLHYPIFNYQI